MRQHFRDNANGRAFIRQGSSGPAHRRGAGVPRRGNPGDYQGSAGMRRRLCGRLSGRTGFALDRRSLRRRGNPGRARGAFRGQRQRGCGRRHAGRLRQLSDPGCGHLQGARRSECRSRCARQSLLRRGDGGRAGDPRRGLRRRFLDHAGAHPCLRHQVPALAAGPAAEPALHREGGAGRLRAIRGVEHAGDPGGQDPRLPRLRRLRGRGQSAPAAYRAGGSGEPAAADRPHRAAAQHLPP